MHDYELDNIFARDTNPFFIQKGTFSYIDALCTLDGRAVKFDRGELEEDAIEEWLPHKTGFVDDEGHPYIQFKLLCIAPENDEVNPKSKLLAKKETYNTIRRIWSLPAWTPRFFDHSRGASASMPIGALAASASKIKSFGVALKNARSHRMITVHDPEARTTSVLLLGSQNVDVTASMLLDRIENSKEEFCFPVMPAFLVIEALEDEINDLQIIHRNRIEAVERRSMFYAFDDEESDDGESDDTLVDFIREYTKIHTLSRNLSMSLDDGLEGIVMVRQMHKHWLDLQKAPDEQNITDRWHDVEERIVFLETLLRKNAVYIEHDQKGIQLSIQTIYALIGNQDSHLNYETAQASLRIAEDSRKVAVLTRYDSTDMRVIAGTTLLFLPATFVATLFSTDFFNFKPNGNSVISGWIWLYWTISAVLTLATLITWRVLSNRREKETSELIGPPAQTSDPEKDDADEDDDEDDEESSEDPKGGEETGEEEKKVEEPVVEETKSTFSFDPMKARLRKGKKTRTMEMEEAEQEFEKSQSWPVTP